ncbi:14561_t:CDS:1, partial [Racocetra persica]
LNLLDRNRMSCEIQCKPAPQVQSRNAANFGGLCLIAASFMQL